MELTSTDIAAIQKHILVLENSKNTSDHIFDILPVVFIILDQSGKLVKVNECGVNFFRQDERRLLGQDFLSLLNEDSRKRFMEYFGNLSLYKVFNDEFELPTDTTGEKFMLWNVNSYAHGMRDQIIHVLIGFDTSDLRKSHLKVAHLERSLEVSRAVQTKLMPKSNHVITKTFQFASCYLSADNVGGDWWWWRELDNGDVELIIGDVTGHGVEAAITTATTVGAHHAIHKLNSFHNKEMSLKEIIIKLNEYFEDLNQGLQLMSLFGARFKAAEEKAVLHFCGAPSIQVYSKGESKSHLRAGPIMGLCLDEFDVVEHEIPFLKGDKMFIPTDGAYEFQDKETGRNYSLAKLRRYISGIIDEPIDTCRDKILEHILSLRADSNLIDDITYVMFERLP